MLERQVVATSPTRTALDPLPLRASTCSLIRAFRGLTTTTMLSGSLALLACQILRGVSSSTRTSRFWLGGKQTHLDRLRRLLPLSVVQKTRLVSSYPRSLCSNCNYVLRDALIACERVTVTRRMLIIALLQSDWAG